MYGTNDLDLKLIENGSKGLNMFFNIYGLSNILLFSIFDLFQQMVMCFVPLG